MSKPNDMITVNVYEDMALMSLSSAHDTLFLHPEHVKKDGNWPGYRDLLWPQYLLANEILSGDEHNIMLVQIANKFVRAYDDVNDWYNNR